MPFAKFGPSSGTRHKIVHHIGAMFVVVVIGCFFLGIILFAGARHALPEIVEKKYGRYLDKYELVMLVCGPLAMIWITYYHVTN